MSGWEPKRELGLGTYDRVNLFGKPVKKPTPPGVTTAVMTLRDIDALDEFVNGEPQSYGLMEDLGEEVELDSGDDEPTAQKKMLDKEVSLW